MAEKAVGYVRVSTQDQANNGVSLDAQEERIRAYAKMADLELIEIIRDNGVSGMKSLQDRKGGAALLKALQRGKATHVVALKLDRLFRDAVDALSKTREWDKRGIALHLIDVGGQAINTSSAMGRMFLTMMAGFAELERNLIAERTALALRHMKANGQAYNHPPLGFDRVGDRFVANRKEAKVVAKIGRWRDEGLSLHKIAARLNDKGVVGKQGGKFYPSTIRAILRNDLHGGGASVGSSSRSRVSSTGGAG